MTLLFTPKDASGPALLRVVFCLALPAVGELLLNTAVGRIDQFFVGHLNRAVAVQLGHDRRTAPAAVGLASLLAWIIATLFMAVAVGATVYATHSLIIAIKSVWFLPGIGEADAAPVLVRQTLSSATLTRRNGLPGKHCGRVD